MEVFFPHNMTVRTVIPELGMEVGHNGGLQGATMLPVYGGNGLILHGGFISPAASKSIYQYSLGDRNWTNGNRAFCSFQNNNYKMY